LSEEGINDESQELGDVRARELTLLERDDEASGRQLGKD
jgi:hypothetical protein